ncbi:ETC complex I subunit [Crenalkalicoccus roseus]|uniref:ETC complex I subunit n=1 Tax=Crenalkalicoccus roseus TaxID=1485588 RepID=UPI001081C082|nr:ETC complex I subunit [Crenalkalicoccus roseus]
MSGTRQLARIFVPPRSAMQSGRGRSQGWVLEFEPAERPRLDPLMGWAGSGDTEGQVRLHFETREQAIAYAEARGLAYEVEEPKPVRFRPKSYAENFRFGRTENWTH